MNDSPRSATAAAALGYGLLVAFLSWPLLTRPGSALVDPLAWAAPGGMWARSDLDLLVWILAWTAHAVIAQPLAIFQANIFHPAPDALASSEHLLGLLPVSGPVFWASGNAILTYNLTTLVVVWAGAFSTFLLVRSWSGRASAGFLGGTLFALGGEIPLSFVRLHGSAIQLYPLILLLAWEVSERPRWPSMIALVLATACQALSGIYVAFGLGALTAAAAPSLVRNAWRHGHRGFAPLAALALGASPLVLVAGAYLRVRDAGLLPDPAEALALVQQASSPAAALARRLWIELTPPGVVLAAVGLFSVPRKPGIRFCLLSIAAVGFVLAMGTHATIAGSGLPSPYELLMSVVPGFSGMRAPGRFLYQATLALVVFSGIGAATLVGLCARRWASMGRRVATAAVVLLAIAVVPLRAARWPLPLTADPLAGLFVASHRWLANHAEPGPVLDLPVPTSAMDGRALRSTGRAMLGSTLHWFPLLNGYSGHPPASHREMTRLATRLPDPKALSDLCALAAPRWIIVHHGLMPDREADWSRRGLPQGIEEVKRLGRDSIFEVNCPRIREATQAAGTGTRRNAVTPTR